jgi:hypothetical protein
VWRVLQRCRDALCGVVVRRVQVEHIVDESKPERHLLLIGVSLPLHYPNPLSHSHTHRAAFIACAGGHAQRRRAARQVHHSARWRSRPSCCACRSP